MLSGSLQNVSIQVSIRIDTNAFPAGVYFVRVELHNKVLTGKLVKQ
ncbi:MAG: T9SS type A sorting domain-containing protein [Bacteroidetes bacterium]|nr:T9SS type A sorting domain-containing protein [Bacteroidota bacterium]